MFTRSHYAYENNLKVTANSKKTSIALHGTTFYRGCKNAIWTTVDFSWSLHLCKQNLCLQHGTQSYFLLRFAVLNSALLSHTSLLIMSAKDNKSEVSSYYKKAKHEFLAGSHAIPSNKRHLNTFCHLCYCKCLHVRKNTRELIDSVFCALRMVCPGSAMSWNRQDRSRQSMQRAQSNWSIGTGLRQNTRTKYRFPSRYFLHSGRNE